eukprot:769732-Pyramimonas_sp.AAC.1
MARPSAAEDGGRASFIRPSPSSRVATRQWWLCWPISSPRRRLGSRAQVAAQLSERSAKICDCL